MPAPDLIIMIYQARNKSSLRPWHCFVRCSDATVEVQNDLGGIEACGNVELFHMPSCRSPAPPFDPGFNMGAVLRKPIRERPRIQETELFIRRDLRAMQDQIALFVQDYHATMSERLLPLWDSRIFPQQAQHPVSCNDQLNTLRTCHDQFIG